MSESTETKRPLYQQRVVDERDELDNKAAKLSEFISHSPLFKPLSETDKLLLIIQLNVMSSYSGILEARIRNFK